MNKKLIPLLLAGTSLLTACNENQTTQGSSVANTPAPSVISKEDAVALVNGIYISKESLAALESDVAQRGQGQSFTQDKLLEELIQREILLQDASQKKLDQSVEFIERLETIKKSLLSQAAIQNFLKSSPVTDADLESEYNKIVAAAGTEYKARHILVKSEEDAKSIIKELDGGADFTALAKSKSTGPSGPQGGDLGWFSAGQMVAPFSDAVKVLADNKYTPTPIKTQFGWHIILREGSRAQTPPPFESVKEQIRPTLQRKKMQDFLSNLRKQAKVEVFLKEPAKIVVPEVKVLDQVKSDIVDSAKKAATDVTKKTADKLSEITEKAVELAKDVTETATNAASEKITDIIKK